MAIDRAKKHYTRVVGDSIGFEYSLETGVDEEVLGKLLKPVMARKAKSLFVEYCAQYKYIHTFVNHDKLYKIWR